MLKNTVILVLFFPLFACAQNLPNNTFEIKDHFSNFKQLTPQQLYDTANYFFGKRNLETALICYNAFIGISKNNTDYEQQKKIVDALNKTGGIYYYISDYHNSYEYFTKALRLCEKIGYESFQYKIHTNIGNIFARFKNYDIAKFYYLKGLHSCEDSMVMVTLLNNIGDADLKSGRMDSALFYLNKSLKISEQYNNTNAHLALNTFALYYQKNKQYDSAYYYYRMSLNEAQKTNRIEKKAEYLSLLGRMFYETNKLDSVQYYLNMSNEIAVHNNFLDIMSENYRFLSKIEELKGRPVRALQYYQNYASLRDSVLNMDIFSDINQLQRLHEISETNQQIEELVFEQHIKERTIHYQKIIWLITLIVLLTVSVGLFIFYFQKKNLSRAYKALFEKNIEIIDLQKNTSEKHAEKYKNSTLSDDLQDELLDKILMLMEDASIICDTEFSLDKMADLVQSNQAYVSQVINTLLNKNFRSFLNFYRIREAQQMYSELDTEKYTVESVAHRVGFKSPSAFRSTFKEITGVSPSFYLKSIQEKRVGVFAKCH
jgi:AraC-like DNA-binding protein/Tfp pilus assembly protein PilF